MRQKEALKVGIIQRVNVTLDRETIAWFKAQMGEDVETGGTRWLELVAQTLRDHARAHADREESSLRRLRAIEPSGNDSSGNARHFASVPKAWGSSRRRWLLPALRRRDAGAFVPALYRRAPQEGEQTADMTLRCRKCGGPATAGKVHWDKGHGDCLGCGSIASLEIPASQERRAPVPDDIV